MTPHESTVAVPVSIGGYSPVTIAPASDPVTIAPASDFDARWESWRARGIAHERAGRRKIMVVASVGGAIATAMAIAYALLRL